MIAFVKLHADIMTKTVYAELPSRAVLPYASQSVTASSTAA